MHTVSLQHFTRFVGVAAASTFILLTACGESRLPAREMERPEVEVVTVRMKPVTVRAELPGRTSAYRVAQVRARVDGIVLQREFQEGSDVKANQLLYRI